MTVEYERLLFGSRLNAQYAYDWVRWQWRKRRLPASGKTFEMGGRAYEYFHHPYNHTWDNERGVELAWVTARLRSLQPPKLLEVGCVLPHYGLTGHDIVDKYERNKSPGLRNEDILDFQATMRYDLIVSISTLEHVGWDEDPRDPEKVLRVIDRLRDLLEPGGTAMITIPVGYNEALDGYLAEGRIPFDERWAMKRINRAGAWIEADPADVLRCAYGEPFPAANGVLLGTLQAGDRLR